MEIKTLVSRYAKYYGGKTALVDGTRRLSFAEVNERTNRLANGLLGLGVKKGDKIAFQGDNKKEMIGPKDLNLIELHDCLTMAEIGHYEDFGLCARGEGMRLIDEGETELGGRIPVNPSGGLLAKGHPIGATGIAQLVEIVWCLRGEAGRRQVENAKEEMAHTMGGASGMGCSVTILKR
jgi:acetyl-CoA acetyltransferase